MVAHPHQPPVRSLLYVPGNKLDWMLKAPKYGSDALILDLEDSVPPEQKVESRQTVRRAIDELAALGRPRIFVRINSVATGLAEGDLEAIVAPGVFAVQLPKADGPESIREIDEIMERFESRAGLPVGQIFLMPLLESAQGLRLAYEVAMAAGRVGYVMGGGSNYGDIALSVGYRETTGEETLYIRSKVVLDARAAGITPICGLLVDIHDLDGVRARAERERNLGYMGANLIHPSHVSIANEVFGPCKADIAYWQGLVAAVEEGQRHGTSAVVYDGKMVDIAHLTFAREMLRRAAEYPASDG